MNLIQQDISYFPKNFVMEIKGLRPPDSKQYFSPEKYYQYGVTVGKIYKAWYLILETPLCYENSFNEILNKPPVESKFGSYMPQPIWQHREREIRLKKLDEEIERKNLVAKGKTNSVTNANNTLLKSTSDSTDSDNPIQAKQSLKDLYSISQLVLIFYYKYLVSGVDPRSGKSSNFRTLAKAIHATLQIPNKNIDKSEIYKKLKKAPKIYNNEQELIKNLIHIRSYFMDYEIMNAMKLIDSEINCAQNEIDSYKY